MPDADTLLPEPVAFPVLGIPSGAWPGTRKLAMRSAVAPRAGDGGLAPSATVALTHTYYLAGQPLPSLVIGQAPAYPGGSGSRSDSAVRLLLRSKQRPTFDAPVDEADHPIRIEGSTVTATWSRWTDRRLSSVRFDWRADRRVSIAAWEYPLDAEFFGTLAEIVP